MIAQETCYHVLHFPQRILRVARLRGQQATMGLHMALV